MAVSSASRSHSVQGNDCRTSALLPTRSMPARCPQGTRPRPRPTLIERTDETRLAFDDPSAAALKGREPAKLHHFRKVPLAILRRDHSGEVADRGDGRPQTASERLQVRAAPEVVIASRALGRRDDLHLTVVCHEFDYGHVRDSGIVEIELSSISALGSNLSQRHIELLQV